jgi:hypothetical protein
VSAVHSRLLLKLLRDSGLGARIFNEVSLTMSETGGADCSSAAGAPQVNTPRSMGRLSKWSRLEEWVPSAKMMMMINLARTAQKRTPWRTILRRSVNKVKFSTQLMGWRHRFATVCGYGVGRADFEFPFWAMCGKKRGHDLRTARIELRVERGRERRINILWRYDAGIRIELSIEKRSEK